ncbi:MAG: GNAT family N-acetyltransferase [Rhodopseudomonas sp.]|nr:GNAT family N-acetyltransferase [Rhodopseudomonas sp.]
MADHGAFIAAPCTDRARLPEVLAVVHAAFDHLQPPSSVMRETLADFEARLRAGTVIVAQADGKIIGSLFAVRDGDALYLTRVATLPAWRRRGVGAALLTAAEQVARQADATRLTLRVRVELPDNRRYFESASFVVTGEGQDPGRPRYLAMERTLTA